MKTELRKPFTYSFVLTEQELRRLHDTMAQQMKRNSSTDDVSSFFELRYKNGVQAEKASLDEVIADNNSGNWEILGLKMVLLSKSQPQKAQIEIEFRIPPIPKSKDATQRPYSIQYYVVGQERDWVYLTSSQLDDRIAHIKQTPILNYRSYAITIGLIMLVVFLTILSQPPGQSKLPLGEEIVGAIASGLIIIGGIACVYGFPLYIFKWGDYIKTFNQRRSIAKYVINGVLISLVLSVIGSLIAGLFFLR